MSLSFVFAFYQFAYWEKSNNGLTLANKDFVMTQSAITNDVQNRCPDFV